MKALHKVDAADIISSVCLSVCLSVCQSYLLEHIYIYLKSVRPLLSAVLAKELRHAYENSLWGFARFFMLARLPFAVLLGVVERNGML